MPKAPAPPPEPSSFLGDLVDLLNEGSRALDAGARKATQLLDTIQISGASAERGSSRAPGDGASIDTIGESAALVELRAALLELAQAWDTDPTIPGECSKALRKLWRDSSK